MHTSLRLERFTGLSASDRAIATAAMRDSVTSLYHAVERVKSSTDEFRFLPLFYHHLDPARIPTSAEMDVSTLPAATTKTITQAFLSFQGVSHLQPPSKNPCTELWQRLWPWTTFFDAHYSHIAGAPSEEVVRAYSFIAIVRLMKFKSSTSRLILSTPGIGILAGQAWGTYFTDPCPATHRSLHEVSQLLLVSSQLQEVNFDEVVEGAGGFHDLAILFARTLEYLLASADEVYDKALNLANVLSLCGRCKDPAWLAALAAHKGLTAALSVLLFADSVFERPSEPPGLYPHLFKQAWNLFLPLVLHGAGYIRKVEAINAGALAFFVSHAQKHVDWMESGLTTLITTILLPVTLYHPVLSAIETALPALEEATSTPAFASSPLYPAWQEFVALAGERILIKNWVDSEEHISYKACDNLFCAKILPKSFFKRCSGCEYMVYCSKECQIVDWRDSHRRRCPITRPPDEWYAIHLDGPRFCTARDRALIRAIVRSDYEAQKEHIFLGRIVKTREHGEGIATVWDYRAGRAKVSVEADPNYATKRDWADRAFRSGAKMHVNYFHPGCWVLPVRASHAEVYSALYTVADTLAPGTREADVSPEVITVVKSMVEISRQIVEII
ncbi:hypothetical protein C8R46DRAFT_496937 [Mycena filopes]|nr:hypothetical protein C8R46DRAFT_496937 [Mycena filopes]